MKLLLAAMVVIPAVRAPGTTRLRKLRGKWIADRLIDSAAVCLTVPKP